MAKNGTFDASEKTAEARYQAIEVLRPQSDGAGNSSWAAAMVAHRHLHIL